ncbi:MAG TPA: histidinol-phosphate transaminase [Actinomycetota bacterium]|nr:histidinol-phosphate transaminase [Actinomycetota bacterium]
MLSLRPDLEEVEPYVSPQLHGVLRMNTNESPYGPPQSVVDALTEAVGDMRLNRYPDRDATGLVDALAEKWEWPREGIWLANGSNEVFMHLFLAFGGPGRTALTFEPTYSLHSLIPRIAMTSVTHLDRDERFGIDVEAALRHLADHSPEIVVVCSPNNPTGDCTPVEVVEELLRAAPGLVVVDEAYAEFAPPEASTVPLLSRYPNLVVVRTFSKAWSLAGVRLGYLLAAEDLVRKMAVVRLPYHLSTLAQAVGVAALGAEEETRANVTKIVAERERVVHALGALPKGGVRARPSDANFVLFRDDGGDGDLLRRCLLEEGVLVRSYAEPETLRPWARVTIGLPEENDEFLLRLRNVEA